MTESPLERLARRASAEPSFLGWQLAVFARVRGWDDETLASHLGCSVAALANVRLCGAIRPEHFREDVMCVANAFGLHAAHLAEATKPLPSDRPQEFIHDGSPGTLLAARDQNEEPC